MGLLGPHDFRGTMDWAVQRDAKVDGIYKLRQGDVYRFTANATPNSRLGWGGIAKTGIIGGSIGAAGLGISSAVGSAEQSIQTGGHGLLVIGAIAAGIILILLLLFRGRK